MPAIPVLLSFSLFSTPSASVRKIIAKSLVQSLFTDPQMLSHGLMLITSVQYKNGRISLGWILCSKVVSEFLPEFNLSIHSFGGNLFFQSNITRSLTHHN